MVIPVGTGVIFSCKMDTTQKDGDQGIVVEHHCQEYKNLGVPHKVRFSDGQEWWTFPNELTEAPQK